MLKSILIVGYAALALASYDGNLNYQSPSRRHESLGVAVHKVVKRQTPGAAQNPSRLNFTHGVASGDPYPDSVILWTRIAPMLDNDRSNITVNGTAPVYNHLTEPYVNASRSPICVNYRVSADRRFQNVAYSGTAFTSSDIDYTVKIEARNLRPFTYYYYQFTVCNSNNTSPLGRTKTTPRPNDKVDTPVRLAVYSCSNFPFGYFNAYGNTVRKDSVDYVIHLGDYIYEYANGEYGWGNSLDRIPQPDREIYTLYDYRRRIATYRTDLDLVASHQNFPWIPVWDDHEVADNTYRDGMSELNNTEQSFNEVGGVSVDQRKMNAVRAYFEWMPIRQVDMDDNLRIWRNFSVGSLLDIIMLDTRNYDRSITDLYWNTDYIADLKEDASRTLMGGRQENWFYRQLSSSKNRGATWRVIGDQIIFSRLNLSVSFGPESPFNLDAWDGYLANRNRTFQHLYDNKIGNNIFLAGDSHANWVSDIVWLDNQRYNNVTGEGSIGVEFAGTAVSSPSPAGQNVTIAQANNVSSIIVRDNPELQWSELYYRGYYELHIDYEQVEARYFGVPTNRRRTGEEIPLATFQVRNGENRLRRNPTVGGGRVENGFLRGGRTVQTNRTVNTGNNIIRP
ncbi:MAG: hypothetical protein M1823_003516 [Watsoniomyces obsoletus]|nr:MAG: hypothetical protein M1823_003516 [Watsoniomyces obsoletus]